MTTQVGVFAKHWMPGQVKTRLAAAIGHESAATVARLFIETLLDRLSGIADRSVIGYSPAESERSFRSLAGTSWRLQPQCAGDLGARMHHYFSSAFADGAERILLLGADSPDVPLEVVSNALDLLADHRLVLGPTDDGGYYLIGASVEPPPVFEHMPWSRETLWEATTSHLSKLGWREGTDWVALPAWYDVDTADDLARLNERLASSEEEPLRTLARQLTELLA